MKVGALYEHYKGDRYLVTDLVIQTVDATVGVIYQAQYGHKLTFARPLAEWLDDVVVDGKALKRFALIA